MKKYLSLLSLTSLLSFGQKQNDLSKMIQLSQDKMTNTISFSLDNGEDWRLFSGNSVKTINKKTPILKGKGQHHISMDKKSPVFFELKTKKQNLFLGITHLPIEGGFNFRDLGGILNKDGQYTQWGKVYRADELQNLTEEDLLYFDKLSLASIVDFRTPEEMAKAPDKIPSSVKNYQKLSIAPGNLSKVSDFKNFTSEQMETFMKELNRLLVTDSNIIQQYQKFFEMLQNQKEIPLLFHCTAGKDRTGMGAALFLSALNVDEETIYENYLASNQYLKEKYAPYMSQYPNFEPLLTVKKEYLKTGLDQIKKDHGSIENYLTNILKVDLKKMRNLYLYP